MIQTVKTQKHTIPSKTRCKRQKQHKTSLPTTNNKINAPIRLKMRLNTIW